MQAQSLKFGALIPPEGFRWIFLEDDGRWVLKDPPAEWPEQDLAAARFYDEKAPAPLLSGRFYLAASTDECMHAHADQQTEFGPLRDEPDLYLRFASEKPTPGRIREFANTYGLLRYSDTRETAINLQRKSATDLLPHFNFEYQEGDQRPLSLRAEPAIKWLTTFELAAFNLKTWAEFEEAGSFRAMSGYLEDGFNYGMGGSLTFQVKMDPDTGVLRTEIIAASLEQLIEVQWGMSIAAHVHHRQCAECPNWFAVHAGSGRPEKAYCSDACRMRAYRKRKVAKAAKPKRSAKKRA